jgi:transposase
MNGMIRDTPGTPPFYLNAVARSTSEEDIVDFVDDAIRDNFLRYGDTFVMDNYAVHRSDTLREHLGRAGITLLFLPKYCPELNPIELLWSKLKYRIRRYGKRTLADALHSMNRAASEVTRADVAGYFSHCGY